jgi:hypothetical protein
MHGSASFGGAFAHPTLDPRHTKSPQFTAIYGGETGITCVVITGIHAMNRKVQ